MNYFAVFDANNFYVSCERVFKPHLQKVPTVVVSAAGGIVLARSNEVKELGIPMAAPVFKFKDIFDQQKIHVLPANFSLYGEISGRIASILHEQFAHVEEYSIDESFIHFVNVSDIELMRNRCIEVRKLILKWTGIPVSVGIAHTKTLAKVAVKYAKKDTQGVVVIASEEARIQQLKHFDIQDVWGIGRALGPKMLAHGIQSALDLANKDPMWGKKNFSVSLAHTINELNSIPCIKIEEHSEPQKTTMATRTFEKEITDIEVLREEMKEFARRIGRHLRRHKEVTGGMLLFVRGNRFNEKGRAVRLQAVELFSPPTAYTPTFLDCVDRNIKKLFFEGIQVKRAGVYCFDLYPIDSFQLGMFGGSIKDLERNAKIMEVIDSIQTKIKKPSLKITI